MLFLLPGISGALGAIIGLAIIWVSMWIRRWVARKALENIPPTEVLKPTVYLRGFKDDSAYTQTPTIWSATTVEESLIQGLLTGGRSVVALGKPGEKLPPLGAQRFYVPDDEWQQVIGTWIDRSFAIVMVATDTMATLWEKEQIFLRGAFDRFLILFAGSLDYDIRVRTQKGLFIRMLSKGEKPLPTIAWQSPTSPESITFDRLQKLAVKGASYEAIPKGYHLIGTAFDEKGTALLFVAEYPRLESLLEVVKWHINHAQLLERKRLNQYEATAAISHTTTSMGVNTIGPWVVICTIIIAIAVGLKYSYDWAQQPGSPAVHRNAVDAATAGTAAPGTDDTTLGGWQRKAELGSSFAQTKLGNIYVNGQVVAQDYSQALFWFQKAADQGDAVAQNQIGIMYYNGFGVPKDWRALIEKMLVLYREDSRK
jgi:Sel1 repeat